MNCLGKKARSMGNENHIISIIARDIHQKLSTDYSTTTIKDNLRHYLEQGCTLNEAKRNVESHIHEKRAQSARAQPQNPRLTRRSRQ